MAETARDIRRRIKAIRSTRKITKAMELVSTAKLKRARKRLEDSRPYYESVIDSIQDILSDNINYPLLNRGKGGSSLYIIFSSDKGLVGAYNGNIFRTLGEAGNPRDTRLITLGRKATEYFSKRNCTIVKSYLAISEDFSYEDAKAIGSLALDLYKNGEVDEIYLLYTKFLGTISYQPSLLKLLPMEGKGGTSPLMEFEPTREEVLNFLLPKYINSSIYGALIESSSSEQAARRMAMESATENADELMEELETSFNRIRQFSITNEITEIISGANN